ncbi:RkpR, polysaccharide export protein [Labrenzia sp. VG12]|uniref:RkpR, polysaccharide export protein n=1 Tax=Labrenzia sp. VG12 TaxID=2021862 RepID=UPI0012FDE45C|nr:RkpR, polysaccharide export protein [Labrenzia sp. VG12]
MSAAEKNSSKKLRTRTEKGEIVALSADSVKELRPTPRKNQNLVDKLKKSGLDPQKLLDLALPATAGKAVSKLRHVLIAVGFFLMVVVPSSIIGGYMFFIASDQYHSVTAFAVRSSTTTPATEVLGMVLNSGSDSVTSNSYIVSDYLTSQAVLEELPEDLGLDEIFNREGADWFFRLGSDLPIEDKLDYWNNMVSVAFDATSGVINVEVRTFRPDDSVKVAEAILERSELLVNQLSAANRRQSLKNAEESVARSEARLKAIRKQMARFREEAQVLSPLDNARLTFEIISGLDQRLAAKEAEKKTLLSQLDANSPRIRILNEEINALKGQIASERKKIGSGLAGTGGGSEPSEPGTSLSYRINDYAELKLEEEFAQQLYTASLAGLEQARKDADSKHLYLATFIRPTLSEAAQYPSRLLYSFSAFLILTGLWIVVVLMYYNIRDRT